MARANLAAGHLASRDAVAGALESHSNVQPEDANIRIVFLVGKASIIRNAKVQSPVAEKQ